MYEAGCRCCSRFECAFICVSGICPPMPGMVREDFHRASVPVSLRKCVCSFLLTLLRIFGPGLTGKCVTILPGLKALHRNDQTVS